MMTVDKPTVIRSRPTELTATIAAIQDDGPDNLHVLADFDRTLTTAFVNGKKIPSLLSILRDQHYLTPDYAAKAQALFDLYHPLEMDPSLTTAQKKTAMEEWWTRHFELLIASGLTKSDIARAMTSQDVRLRQGAEAFFSTLARYHVPLIIMSATGLGIESIALFLEHRKLLTDTVHIISNSYEWDGAGRAVAVRKPIIHSFNKDETAIQNFPAYEMIRNRKNVLLLGDTPGDTGMVTGFDYRQLLKIGFLNEQVAEHRPLYEQHFDVIITGDGPLDYVNILLTDLLTKGN